MQAAVIAAAYPEGVLRAASGRGQGWLGGRACPLLGRVSMDLITLHLSDRDARPDNEVELFGPHPALDEVATATGTIAFEGLTRVGERVARRYVGAED